MREDVTAVFEDGELVRAEGNVLDVYNLHLLINEPLDEEELTSIGELYS